MRLWILFVAFAIIWACVWTYAVVAHGQDVDCSQNKVDCSKTNQIEREKFLHDLQLATEIWNAANCSVRDICTPVGNTTWNCEPGDETFNITGRCDPDKNDTRIENQALACFATKELADNYIKQYGNQDTITVPCPPFQLPHQEDESGK